MGLSMRTPQGAVVWVDDGQIAHATANGYTPASAEAAGAAATKPDTGMEGIGGALVAGATEGLSGATLGLSDAAIAGVTNRGTVDAIRAAREAHPIISTGANVAGALAPAFLTGGESLPSSLAARAGGSVSESLGGGYLARGVGGAAEGALFGAGQGVGELAMSRDPLTLEHAASTLSSNMLYGAEVGAAGGVAFKGLEEGFAAAKGALDNALITRSGERAMKAVGELDAAAAAEPSAIGPETDVTRLDSKGLKIAREQEVERLHTAQEPERRAFVDELSASREKAVDEKAWLATKGGPNREVRKIGLETLKADQRIDSLLRVEADLVDKPGKVLSALRQQQQALEELQAWGRRATDDWVAEFQAGPAKIRQELLDDVERIKRGQEPRVPGFRADALTPAGLDNAVSKVFRERFGRDALDARLPLHDQLPTNLRVLGAVPDQIARNRALQDRLIELGADPVSERLMSIDAAEQSLGVKTSAPPVHEESPIGHVLRAAAHAAGPLGAVASSAAGALGKLRSAAAAGIERAGRTASDFLGTAGKSLGKFETAVPVLATKALAQLRYGDAGDDAAAGDRKAPATLPGLYKARTDEIKRQVHIAPDGTFQMRPEARQKMAAKLAGLGAVDPLAADRLESAGAKRIAWLASQIPRRPDIAGVQTGPDTWHPSDLEMRTWARKAAAADDPQGVLERVISGRVTPEDAQTMRALYPEIMQDFVQTVSVQLPALRKTLPYQKKLALSLFSGVPVDPALDPKILSFLQGQFVDEHGTSGGTAAPKASPQFGSIKKSPDAATPAQARAQGAHV